MTHAEPPTSDDELCNVFTYGSLMYPDIFEQVTGYRPNSLPARANHWQRYALANRTYPGALARPEVDTYIEGILWLDVSKHGIEALDRFEGHEYRRVNISVQTHDGQKRQAFIYEWLEPDQALGDWDTTLFERKHRHQFVQIHGTRQD